MRPNHYYKLSSSTSGEFVLNTNKYFPDDLSEAAIAAPWWPTRQIGQDFGIGQGMIVSDIDWYTMLADEKLPILKVTDTTHDGRPVYKVVCGENKEGNIKHLSTEIDFDKSNFMAFRVISTVRIGSKPEVKSEELLTYDSKLDDYDSIVLKGYQEFVESKGQNIPRHVQREQIYTI